MSSDKKERTPISIQYKGPVPPGRREDRTRFLTQVFTNVAGILTKYGVAIDMNDLSVSGQAVPATVPENNFASLSQDLQKDQFEVRHNPTIRIVN